MSKRGNEKKAVMFRRRAIRYCVHHKLIADGMNHKNSALKRMVMEHSGAQDEVSLKAALEGVCGPLRKSRKAMPAASFMPKSNVRVPDEEFFGSRMWKELRYFAIRKYGRKCLACGAGPDTGKTLHVDHIKPRLTHPELQWDINNLQVLCEDCNIGKGWRDSTDWRGPVTDQGQRSSRRNSLRNGNLSPT
jgi:hypothetical protein